MVFAGELPVCLPDFIFRSGPGDAERFVIVVFWSGGHLIKPTDANNRPAAGGPAGKPVRSLNRLPYKSWTTTGWQMIEVVCTTLLFVVHVDEFGVDHILFRFIAATVRRRWRGASRA